MTDWVTITQLDEMVMNTAGYVRHWVPG
jgi:hypothetical protein